MTKAEMEMDEKWKTVTHDYIATSKCGCILACASDIPWDAKGTAKSVADFIRSGYAVSRVSLEEFRGLKFGHRDDCAARRPEPQASLFGEGALGNT